MRIAVSGTHRSGKSSLIEALSTRLPRYALVDEPYHSMVEEGFEFNHPPSLEDFVAQLERSLEDMADDAGDVLFDRCPVDLLAYALVHADADGFDLEDWLPRVRETMETLDFVVFVPIEAQDRIRVARDEDPDASRAAVDEKLRELLLDDALELGVEVLEVKGDVERRVRAVLKELQASAE